MERGGRREESVAARAARGLAASLRQFGHGEGELFGSGTDGSSPRSRGRAIGMWCRLSARSNPGESLAPQWWRDRDDSAYEAASVCPKCSSPVNSCNSPVDLLKRQAVQRAESGIAGNSGGAAPAYHDCGGLLVRAVVVADSPLCQSRHAPAAAASVTNWAKGRAWRPSAVSTPSDKWLSMSRRIGPTESA